MKRIFLIIALGFCNYCFVVAQCSTVGYSLTSIVKTPKNSTVQHTYTFTGTDFTPYNSSQLTDLETELKTLYDQAIKVLDGPSLKYNCHAYTFHLSEGYYNKVWMSLCYPSAFDIYFTDISYVSCAESEASKVVYYMNSHSAIRINSSKYESKWGSGPLVQHPPNVGPAGYYPTSTKTYYKSTAYLDGPTTICGEESYVVYNSNYTVYWSCSPNLTMIDGNTGSYKTFVATGTGSTWVRATIGSFVLEKTGITVTGTYPAPTSSNANASVNSYVSINPPNSSYNYEYYCDKEGNGMHFMSSSGSSTSVYISSPGSYTVTAHAMNACGYAQNSTHTT